MRQVGATLHRSAWASHRHGLSCCGAQAPDAQAQQSWLAGPAAPRHVGSSQTRARTRVPRIGRQALNHCATREAQKYFLKKSLTTIEKHKLRTYSELDTVLDAPQNAELNKTLFIPQRNLHSFRQIHKLLL